MQFSFKTSSFANMKQNCFLQWKDVNRLMLEASFQENSSWEKPNEESPESAADDICPICGSHLIIENNVIKCSFELCKYKKPGRLNTDEAEKQ